MPYTKIVWSTGDVVTATLANKTQTQYDAAKADLDAHVAAADPHPQYVDTNEYTAADVLTKLKTVDGAGSGLDADLFDGLNSNAFAKEYQATIGGFSSAGWTTIAFVDGFGLNSKIKLTMGGTTNSVVVAVMAEIIVNHSQDIFVLSKAGNYTTVTLRIISDANENFYIQAITNSANVATLDCRIFTYGGEAITMYTNNPSPSGTITLDHVCYVGQLAISSTGGVVAGMRVNGNTVWHAGNDGAGSGLDADTVDGVHGTGLGLKTDLIDQSGYYGDTSAFGASVGTTYVLVRTLTFPTQRHRRLVTTSAEHFSSNPFGGETTDTYVSYQVSGGSEIALPVHDTPANSSRTFTDTMSLDLDKGVSLTLRLYAKHDVTTRDLSFKLGLNGSLYLGAK
jgi:hypothetical protein